MTLLSVVIEYLRCLSKDDITTHYDKIREFIVFGLSHEEAKMKGLAILSISNVAKATTNVKVLKSFQEMIPLILERLDKDDEE